jgi:WXG100 family type VII secretion target
MAGIGSFSVQTGQVSQYGGELQSESQAIRATLDDLEAQIRTLLGEWSGEAQGAYNTAQTKWDQQFAEMQGILTKIAAATQEIAQGYSTTDSKAAGYFG